MALRIDVPKKELEDFCHRWDVVELAFFGSVLRDDFRPESDLDVLVRFDETAHHTLFDMVTMEEELAAMFGRSIDLVSRRGLEASPNYLRRSAILGSAEVVYGA